VQINLRNIRTPSFIRQDSSRKYRHALSRSEVSSSLAGLWGIVVKANSDDVTVDVKLRNGIEIRRVKVRSLEWSGYNSNRGFGERDLPPVGSKVFILLPDGEDVLDTAFVICSVVDTVWETGEKAKAELAVSSKEREALRITEQGWQIKRDKDTGDVVIETSDGTDKIIISLDRTNRKVKISVGTVYLEITNAQVNISGDSKSLVTYAALNTALGGLVTAINSTFATKQDGGGAAGTLSLDISASEAQKAKTS